MTVERQTKPNQSTGYDGIAEEIPMIQSGLECGYPGAPAFGRPHPVKELYRPGDAVSFTCAHGHSLQGALQRVCLLNGTWAGLLPLCDRSLSSVDQQASSRQTLSLYPPRQRHRRRSPHLHLHGQAEAQMDPGGHEEEPEGQGGGHHCTGRNLLPRSSTTDHLRHQRQRFDHSFLPQMCILQRTLW
ncbi:uncharacterized protein CEXT_415641 [Caerostris extrusa]|uniref:Sushi domain-containing protein n=1 Tax=Caerostris extrusa TaxID=172846 RepID=A0AAV4SUM1_CAEEX|nr:uncharacterized protein CEXT_415641 [Caerostris extrusa]